MWTDRVSADRYNQTRRQKYSTISGRANELYRSAKKSAQRNGLEFTLTHEWVEDRLSHGHCEVTGIPFDMETKPYGNNPFAPSLDRTIASEGYTTDNVKLVVWMYNTCKQKNRHEDVLRFAESLVSNERSR